MICCSVGALLWWCLCSLEFSFFFFLNLSPLGTPKALDFITSKWVGRVRISPKYLRRTLQFHYNHYLCNHPQGNAWKTYPGTTLFQRWSFSVVITKPKASAGMFWWGSTQRRPATLHLPIEEKSKIIFFCLCDAQIFCFSIRSMWWVWFI